MSDLMPIKRPSVTGIVGDNAHRMRNVEAGQTMPYCFGTFGYSWAANTVPPGYYTNSTTQLTIPLTPVGSGPDSIIQFDTTDNSILSNAKFPGGPDDGGCIHFKGGGLWYWETKLSATDMDWYGSAGLHYPTSGLFPEYVIERTDNPRPLSGPQFGASNFTSAETLVQGGIFSTLGYIFGYTPDESQPPSYPNQIVATINKCDPADAGSVFLWAMCARWTPVGFSYFGGE